jgi:hypothetical protein
VSWKPLVKSKASAVATTMTRRRSLSKVWQKAEAWPGGSGREAERSRVMHFL